MIRIQVCKLIQRDNYENGCSLSDGSDFGIIETRNVKTMDEVLDFVSCFGEPMIFEERLDVQATENDAGETPSASEMEAFKRGEIDLWCVDYSFYIARVEVTPIDHAELVAAFPSLEVA